MHGIKARNLLASHRRQGHGRSFEVPEVPCLLAAPGLYIPETGWLGEASCEPQSGNICSFFSFMHGICLQIVPWTLRPLMPARITKRRVDL